MKGTTLVIKYPNGATQTVTPNDQFFKGGWGELAYAIAGRYFPSGKVVYEVK